MLANPQGIGKILFVGHLPHPLIHGQLMVQKIYGLRIIHFGIMQGQITGFFLEWANRDAPSETL